MRKLTAIALLAGSITLLFSVPASAQSYGFYGQRGLNSPGRQLYNPDRSSRPWAGIDARQRQQNARIVQGVRSGTLTPREANALRHDQWMIRWNERRYLADGVLTRGERWQLQRDLDAASRHIQREKRDSQRR